MVSKAASLENRWKRANKLNVNRLKALQRNFQRYCSRFGVPMHFETLPLVSLLSLLADVTIQIGPQYGMRHEGYQKTASWLGQVQNDFNEV